MLSAALLAAAVGLRADVPPGVVIAVCVASALVALLALFANATGHTYYRATRETKGRLEERLRLRELALTTTGGMGSPLSTIGKVRHFQTVMLVVLVIAAIGTAIAEVVTANRAAPRTVRVALSAELRGKLVAAPFVISRRDGSNKVVASAKLDRREPRLLELRPGRYQVSILASPVCVKPLNVGAAPLQARRVSCP